MVPRRAAEPRLAALALSLSAGRVPVSAADRRERPPWSRDEPEFELLDTGVFDRRAVLVVDVAYAKASPTEILARITIENHAAEAGDPRRCCPTLWFRNTWRVRRSEDIPALSLDGDAIAVDHPGLAATGWRPHPARTAALPQALFCDNETNNRRLFGCGSDHRLSQGRDQRPRGRRRGTVDPDAAGHEGRVVVPDHRSRVVSVELRLRLHQPGSRAGEPAAGRHLVRATISTRSCAAREREADEFYAAIAPDRHRRPNGCACCVSRARVWSGASRCTRTG